MRILQLFAIFLLAVISSPALACSPAPINPTYDAKAADVIFVGIPTSSTYVSVRNGYKRLVLTVTRLDSLKGKPPQSLQIAPKCGSYYPDLYEKVVVVIIGPFTIIRKADETYTKPLTAALAAGR